MAMQFDDEAKEELECILQDISEEIRNDPEIRERLHDDPNYLCVMLEEHGIDTKKLPQEVLEGIAAGHVGPQGAYFGGLRVDKGIDKDGW
nr:hypothetical protein [Gammaproteobacteria bacterium]